MRGVLFRWHPAQSFPGELVSETLVGGARESGPLEMRCHSKKGWGGRGGVGGGPPWVAPFPVDLPFHYSPIPCLNPQNNTTCVHWRTQRLQEPFFRRRVALEAVRRAALPSPHLLVT